MITTILTLHVIIVISYITTCSIPPNASLLTLNYSSYQDYITFTLISSYKMFTTFHSLVYSTTDGTTPDTVIQCNSSVGIVMTNVTNLIVTNITVRSCLGNEYNNATVLIKQCTNVQLRHVVIEESHNSYGIVSINVLGDSHFSFISNHRMEIIYNDTTVNKENHSLTIDHYHNSKSENSGVEFKFQQSTYRVKFTLINSIFQMIHTWQLIKTHGSVSCGPRSRRATP